MSATARPNRQAPRLAVLLAAEAPVGVVLRRGPTKLVQVIIWNRETDKFRLGPWFKGRIFADRSDVSPDGRHLIYFAMGGVAWAIPATGGTWTAISTLPSLKADALWGQGDTWGGGGVFTSNNSFWLNADENTFLIHDNSGLRRDTIPPASPRLLRKGWVCSNSTEPVDCIYSKLLCKGWFLRKLAKDSGYELEQPGIVKLTFSAWEWAEWDRDRLVWTEHGCLYTAKPGAQKLSPACMLFDFNE